MSDSELGTSETQLVAEIPFVADIPLVSGTDISGRPRYLRLCYRTVEKGFRRDLDFTLALLGLILFSPVILIIACLIATDGGSVFFSHQRVGRNGVMFGCWKFRTMMVGAEDCLPDYLKYHPHIIPEWLQYHKLAADPRVTPLGSFLRRTSLDELPQLWNVLAGEMSLVGPRPVTSQEMCEHYGPYAAVVTSVRPGLTGLWQVSGRNDVDYSSRVLLDYQYVRTQTLLSDLIIVAQTVPAVLWAKGAR